MAQSQTEMHEENKHEHPSYLAHHFDTSQQQFDAGKLGIWLFLTTEILLFSGLFCAYAVYRANHPEIFRYAHLYLNKWLGGINTLVLIFSSLTMAWAVRSAQLGHRKALTVLLTITLLCGFVFLGIKYVEYKNKWEEGLLTGQHYQPKEPPPGVVMPGHSAEVPATTTALPTTHPTVAVPTTAPAITTAPGGYVIEQSTIPPAATGERGINPHWIKQPPALPHGAWVGPEPANVQLFFGIYFVMTGLHGLHVIAGMAIIGWILYRSARGDFGPHYYNPVDFTGLYWHLVDLVWIFLFPLLYLIS